MELIPNHRGAPENNTSVPSFSVGCAGKREALQAGCLQGLQPLRQALYEKSLDSVLFVSSLLLIYQFLLLVEARC